MDNTVKVVGNNEEGWNVEVAINGTVTVFACECREAAENLREEIGRCSWIESREASQS